MKFRTIKKIVWVSVFTLTAGIARAAYSTYSETIGVARAQFQKNDYASAQKTTEEALSLAKTPDEKVGALLRLGLTYSQRKLFEQARQQWAKVLQLPDASTDGKIQAQYAIAASYGEEKNWGRCAVEMQKVVDAPNVDSQTQGTARFALAAALIAQKKDVEAQSQLLTIAQNKALDSNFRATSYTQLGQSLINTRQFDQARAAFTSVLDMPDVNGQLMVLAQGGIAHSYEVEGNAVQAQKEFATAQTQAIEQSQMFSANKQYSMARAVLEQALTFGTVAPTVDAGMRAQIGQILLAEGKPKEARTQLLELVNKHYGEGIAPEDAATLLAVKQSAQLSIAKSYVQDGNKAQAQQVLQSLLATDNLNPDVKVEVNNVLKGLS